MCLHGPAQGFPSSLCFTPLSLVISMLGAKKKRAWRRDNVRGGRVTAFVLTRRIARHWARRQRKVEQRDEHSVYGARSEGVSRGMSSAVYSCAPPSFGTRHHAGGSTASGKQVLDGDAERNFTGPGVARIS